MRDLDRRSPPFSRALCIASIGISAASIAACGSPSSDRAPSGSGEPPSAGSTLKPRASAADPSDAPRPRSPFDLDGDPFAGAPKAAGTIVEIPRARGFVVVAPLGWKAEKDAANGNAVLVPPRGTAKVLVAAESSDKALDQRVTRFLQESMTREETWQSEKETRVGTAGLTGFYLRGIGYQGFPGGRREPHKVLRVRIPTDVKEATGTLVVQALAVWNGADVESEVEIVEAVKGIQRR